MAERLLSSAVGDAIVALIDWTWPRVSTSARQVLSSVADVVRPEPPVTLVGLDGGEVLTGVALMHRGRVLAFLGERHGPLALSGPLRPAHVSDDPLRTRCDDPYWR